jgi:predicted transport protein
MLGAAMVLFKVSNGKVKPINFSKLRNEKSLQSIVEQNLEEIFGLVFIETEFVVPPFRLDTITFDKESNALVIIEYKESEDYSVIDQGYSYLNLLLNHKGDFQLALERKLNKRIEVDWSQSRIIFIAKAFNAYQLGALSQNLPFELWKYVAYDEGIISFDQLKPQFTQAYSMPKGKIAQEVEKEIKVYTLEDHLKRRPEKIKEILEKLRQAILDINPEIKEKVTKKYIAYEMNRNFTEFVIQSSAVKVYLDISTNELNDTAHIAQDCSNVGHWATGDTRFKVYSTDEVPYAIGLIKQAYEKSLR